MSSSLREKLIVRVTEAFQDTEYPFETDLFNSPFYAESVELDQAFEGMKWQEISTATAIKYQGDMFYFTIPGLIYFLPSFLLTLLKSPFEADSLYYALLMVLSPVVEPPSMLLFPSDYQSLGMLLFPSESDYQSLVEISAERANKLKNAIGGLRREVIIEFLDNYKDLFSEPAFELIDSEAFILDAAAAFWKSE